MKKILPMILILSFSLPAMAAEQILVCKVGYPNNHNGYPLEEIFIFDPVNKVFREAEGSHSGDFSDSEGIYIDDTKMEARGSSHITTIIRIDGSYKWTYRETGQTVKEGKCAPLKQAF
jgi:hypothetical protein